MHLYERAVELHTDYVNNLKFLLEGALARLDPSIKIIFVAGTTPTYNDGDACEHSSEAHIGYKQIKDSEWDCFFAGLRSTIEEYESDFEVEREDVKGLAYLLCRICDEEYQTNYGVTITRHGSPSGSWKFSKEDYEEC